MKRNPSDDMRDNAKGKQLKMVLEKKLLERFGQRVHDGSEDQRVRVFMEIPDAKGSVHHTVFPHRGFVDKKSARRVIRFIKEKSPDTKCTMEYHEKEQEHKNWERTQ